MPDSTDKPESPTAPSCQGRVRHRAESALDGGHEIGITLGSTEHLMPVYDAITLANRIISTAVDKETRYAE